MTPTELALVGVLVFLGSVAVCLVFALYFSAARRVETEAMLQELLTLLHETNEACKGAKDGTLRK